MTKFTILKNLIHILERTTKTLVDQMFKGHGWGIHVMGSWIIKLLNKYHSRLRSAIIGH